MTSAGGLAENEGNSGQYEAARLAALRRTQVLDAEDPSHFNDVAALAALICETPIALVCFVESEHVAFKATHGLKLREIPRSLSFCTHTIEHGGQMMVSDTHADDRFNCNPLVVDPPAARFYCGSVIRSCEGFPIGTLCVLDNRPRSLTSAQRSGLDMLARQIEERIGNCAAPPAAPAGTADADLFRGLVNAQDTLICSVDSDGRYSFANRAYEIWFGAERGELRGKRVEDVLGARSYAAVKPLIEQALAGESVRARSELKRPGDSLREIEVQLEPYRIAATVSGYHAIVNDITDKRRTEQALVESEERLRLATRASGVGAWEYRCATGELIWDDRCLEMFGLPAGAPIDYESFIRAVHPEDRTSLEQRLQTTIERGGAYQKRYRALGADGKLRWIDSEGMALRSPDKSVRLVGTKRDITQAKRNADAQQRLYDCARVTGPDFFAALTEALAFALGVRHAFMCEIHPDRPDRLRALASWTNGGPGPEIDYAYEGTPCSVVLLSRNICFYRRDVARAFPEDPALVDIGAHAYLGVPLLSAEGKAIGVLSVIHDDLIDETLDPQALLSFLAGRAAAELKRQRAERSLREREEQLRLTTDSAQALMFLVGPDLVYRFVNKAFETWFGLPRDQVIGRHMRDIIGAEAFQLVQPHIEHALAGEASRGEIVMPYAHGGRREILVEYTPRLSPSGAVEGLVGLVHDVSERKRVELALAENQERLLMALETARMGAWIRNLQTNHLETNDQFRIDFGCSPDEELTLEEAYKLVHQDDRERVQALVDQSIREGSAFEAEFRIIRDSGEERWVVARGQSYFDAAGQPSHMVGVELDVTEARQAEEARRDYNRRFKAIFDQTSQFMAVLTPEGRIVDVNAAALRGRDSCRASIMGRPIWDAPWWNDMPAMQALWRETLAQSVASAGSIIREGEFRAARGEIRTARYATTSIRDEAGKVVNVLVEGIELTDRANRLPSL